VGLAKNDIYNSKLSDDIKKSIEDIQKKVLDGEIKISTAIGMSSDDLAKLKSSVAP
jgi:basic membrane protein A